MTYVTWSSRSVEAGQVYFVQQRSSTVYLPEKRELSLARLRQTKWPIDMLILVHMKGSINPHLVQEEVRVRLGRGREVKDPAGGLAAQLSFDRMRKERGVSENIVS